ncbi:MAG TPA: ABC transporter ATP-binding protein [Arachnia sp.]|nr:ABC transporter ATP-binding protein [Arachnia sp.]
MSHLGKHVATAATSDAPVVSAIRASNLRRTYGTLATAVNALEDVTFEIPRGEFVVLLGPSGSGKTTMLNVIGALDAPTAGSLEVMATSLSDMNEDERTRYRLSTIGFVFQFFNLVPTLTALENVSLLAEITGAQAGERARRALDQVGLGDRTDHFPGQLSGGEQQRVSIARALVKDVPLLLCDEPTGALDIDTGTHILRVLRDTTDRGCTVLLVTHNSEIARMADRVLRLRDGRLVSDEPNATPVAPEDLRW